MQGRRVASRFRELEVELDPAAPSEVADGVLARLREAGAGAVDNVPKLVRALGPAASDPPEVVVPEIGPDSTVREVVRRALSASVVRLLRHDAGVRLGEDPEDVHQARVATRRMRSDLRAFRDVVEPAWSVPLREELRWLGAELGAVRDAEVLRDRLRGREARLAEEDRGAVERLVAGLDRRRDEARDRLLSSMREPRYATLLDALVAAAGAPAVLEEVAEAPASVALRPALEAPWKHLSTAIDRVRDEASDQALHAARIRAKRVRYAAEALAPVFGKRARAFAQAAVGLQDVLGEHQDSVVAAAWLREVVRADTVARLRGRPAGRDRGRGRPRLPCRVAGCVEGPVPQEAAVLDVSSPRPRPRGRGDRAPGGRRRAARGAGAPAALRRLELPQGQAPGRRVRGDGRRPRGRGGDGAALPPRPAGRSRHLRGSPRPAEDRPVLGDDPGERVLRARRRGRRASVASPSRGRRPPLLRARPRAAGVGGRPARDGAAVRRPPREGRRPRAVDRARRRAPADAPRPAAGAPARRALPRARRGPDHLEPAPALHPDGRAARARPGPRGRDGGRARGGRRPIESVVAFARSLGAEPVVVCGHGREIDGLVRGVAAEGAEVEGVHGLAKGSVWVLERREGRVVSARYLPAPRG